MNEEQPPNRNLLRAGLLAPPVLLLAGGIGLLVAAPFAWGAANSPEFEDWLPTFAGVAFGLPTTLIGATCLAGVRSRTRHAFSTAPVQLIPGLVILLAGAATLSYATQLGDPAFYDRYRNDDAMADLLPAGSVVFTAIGAALLAAFVTALAYAYAHAIEGRDPSRSDRRPDEPDAMGALIDSMPGSDRRG